MVKVLCLLRSGGDFKPAHAARLYDQFLKHSPPGIDFACLTDMTAELDLLSVPAIPLAHSWPSWWNKIAVLSIEGPVLYLDLDVTIIGDLTLLLEAAGMFDFVMLRDWWGMQPHGVNSSVMAWNGDGPLHVYDAFLADPERFMYRYRSPEHWGDQGFIRDHFQGEMMIWQHVAPGLLRSYKKGLLEGEPLDGTICIISHGNPRPWVNGGADDWLTRRSAL